MSDDSDTEIFYLNLRDNKTGGWTNKTNGEVVSTDSFVWSATNAIMTSTSESEAPVSFDYQLKNGHLYMGDVSCVKKQ